MVFNNGICLQWLKTVVAGDDTLTFPKAFTTTNYAYSTSWSYTRETSCYGNFSARTKTNVTLQSAGIKGKELLLFTIGY